MKNLKLYIDILEDPDDLLIILDVNQSRRNYYWNRWSSHTTNHPVDGVHPWDRAVRISESHIGKPFSVAFSKFCKESPVYQQHIFLEEFDTTRRWRFHGYFIDDNGNIQKIKKDSRGKNYVYKSDDYKVEKVHKITGKKYDDIFYKRKVNDNDYHYVVVSGYAIEFDSPTPEYRRLTTDQKKRNRIKKKKELKEKNAKAYSFLTKDEKELIKQKRIDYFKILKHGFDPETSFRGNSVNPDSIKEIRGY